MDAHCHAVGNHAALSLGWKEARPHFFLLQLLVDSHTLSPLIKSTVACNSPRGGSTGPKSRLHFPAAAELALRRCAGLPWLIAAVQLKIEGATPVWRARVLAMDFVGNADIVANNPGGAFVVPAVRAVPCRAVPSVWTPSKALSVGC